MIGLTAGFGNRQLVTDAVRDPARNLVLQIEQIIYIAVEALGPKVRPAFGVDQLRVYANLLSQFAHAPFEHVAHV